VAVARTTRPGPVVAAQIRHRSAAGRVELRPDGLAIHAGGDAGVKVGWWVLALCYLLQTLGELALSPIGYGLVGQLAAEEEASLAMGGWFFGVALAYQLAGWIAIQTTPEKTGSGLSGITDYAHVYGALFWSGLAVAAVFLLAAPWIRRLMHGVH
jgi:POT family proton-dependent oligopeptide transporter